MPEMFGFHYKIAISIYPWFHQEVPSTASYISATVCAEIWGVKTKGTSCVIMCLGDPEFCIGENLFRQMADMIVTGGYKVEM